MTKRKTVNARRLHSLELFGKVSKRIEDGENYLTACKNVGISCSTYWRYKKEETDKLKKQHKKQEKALVLEPKPMKKADDKVIVFVCNSDNLSQVLKELK